MPKPIATATVVTSSFLNDLVGVYDRVGSLDVVSDLTERTLYSKTISGGHLSTIRTLRLTLIGDYLNNTGSSQSLTAKIKFGGTTFAGDGSGSFISGTTRRNFELRFLLGEQSATNAQFLKGAMWFSETTAGSVAGIGQFTSGITSGGAGGLERRAWEFSGSGTIDTTADRLLEVTVQHSASSASLSIRRQYAILELM